MMRITDLAHALIAPVLKAGDVAIDATTGNGYDTAMLARAVGSTGAVFAFDIQAAALKSASARIGALPHVHFIEASHETMREHLPTETHGRVAAIMFNLGYLPSGDKGRTTQTASTLKAIEAALTLLRIGGRVSIVAYPGHPAGAQETEAVRMMAQSLPAAFTVIAAQRINAATAAPQVFIVERTA